MKYNYWSPFANKEYAMHQLKLIARNFQTIVHLLCGFDLIGIGLLGHLPDEVLARTRTVGIPMAGEFDSLNVAATSGIALHHLVFGRV